jgi:hypothetical protein
MSHSSRPASRCGKALASPHVSWHQSCLPAGEGSGVAMCHVVLDPPPSAGGLSLRHVSHGTRPAPQQGRAPVSPRVPRFQTRLPVQEGSDIAVWLSACYGPQGKGKYSAGLLIQLGPPTFEACPCVPKMLDIRLIMTSPGTRSRQHITCIQDSHTRCMGSIECVQDIDTVRRQQYGAGLLVTHNGKQQSKAS